MFHQVFICNNDETVEEIKDQQVASLTESSTLKCEDNEQMDEIVEEIKDQQVASLIESSTLKCEDNEQMDEIDANDLKPPDIKMETDVLKVETDVLKVEKEEPGVIDKDMLMDVKQELKAEEVLGKPDVTLDLVATKYPEIFKRKGCKIKDETELRNRELPTVNENKLCSVNESMSKSDDLFNRDYNNIEYKQRKLKSDNKIGIGHSTIEIMEIPINEFGEDNATKIPFAKSTKNKEAPSLMKVINSEFITPVNFSLNCNKENKSAGQAIGEEYKYGISCNEELDSSRSGIKDIDTDPSCGGSRDLETDASCSGSKDQDTDRMCVGGKDLGRDPSCGGIKDLDTNSNSSGCIDIDTDSIQNPNNTINQLIPGVELQVSLNNTKSNPTKKAFAKISFTATEQINHNVKSKSSSEIMHNCKVCNQVFKRKRHLSDHMNIHSKKKPYKCNDCGKEYCSKTALISHNRKGHRTAVSAKETVIKELKLCSRDPNKNTFNNDLFMCKKCKACFDTEKNLQNHVRYTTLCGGYKRARQHQCDICGKSFPGLQRLVAHQNTHTNNRPFKCSECEKHFKCTYSLKYHRKTVHEKSIERYLCCFCGFMHASISHMLAHEKVHSLPEGEEIPKPFKCLECGKGFISKFTLKSHERHHKLLKCPKCPELFQNRQLRYKHLDKVHNTVKEHKCDICSKVFKNRMSFNCHKYVHTAVLSFFCDVCDKGFKQKHHLEQHLITHSDYRPIVCPECGDTFKRKTHLKQHAAAFHGDGKKR